MEKKAKNKILDDLLLLGTNERKEILTLAVKELYNTIGPDDILRQNDKGEWLAEDKIISEAEKKLLISEANQFLSTRLWKILQADIKYQANKKMYLESQSDDDITFGKMWSYTLDVVKTRLQSLRKGSGHFNI